MKEDEPRKMVVLVSVRSAITPISKPITFLGG